MKRSHIWEELSRPCRRLHIESAGLNESSSDAILIDNILARSPALPIRHKCSQPGLKYPKSATITLSSRPRIHGVLQPKVPVTRSIHSPVPPAIPTLPEVVEAVRPPTPPICDHSHFRRRVKKFDSNVEIPSDAACMEDLSKFSCPSSSWWMNGTRRRLNLSSIPSQHRGQIRVCENSAVHGEASFTVCEECACIGHHHLEKQWPKLLDSPLLPLCFWCSKIAKKKHPVPYEYDGCKCPVSNPTKEGKTRQEKWLCFTCRLQMLKSVNAMVETEEEYRRGVLGGGYHKGVAETILIGRLCVCLRELGGTENLGRSDEARRCPACMEFWHSGVK